MEGTALVDIVFTALLAIYCLLILGAVVYDIYTS